MAEIVQIDPNAAEIEDLLERLREFYTRAAEGYADQETWQVLLRELTDTLVRRDVEWIPVRKCDRYLRMPIEGLRRALRSTNPDDVYPVIKVRDYHDIPRRGHCWAELLLYERFVFVFTSEFHDGP